MDLKYATTDPACQPDWESGRLMCTSGRQPRGRGWYAGEWGGAAESQSYDWTPVWSTIEYAWDGGTYQVAIDKPLPDPGFPFAINFATLEPGYSLMTGKYALGVNPISQYLTDTYGAAINAALNAEYRAPLLAGIASGALTVNPGPTWPNPGTPYDPKINGDGNTTFALMYNGVAKLGNVKLRQLLTAAGGASDPIVAAYLDWWEKANVAAYQQYKAMEKADTKAFWTKALVATSLAFGGVASIMAITQAAAVGSLGAAEIAKGAQLAYKAYSGIQTLSAGSPSSLGLSVAKPPPSQATLENMQGFVDQVTVNGLLQSSYDDALAAVDLATSDPVGAQAKLDSSREAYADAQATAAQAGMGLAPNAVAAIEGTQAHADKVILSPAELAAIGVADGAVAQAEAAIDRAEAGDFDGALTTLDIAAGELSRARDMAAQLGMALAPAYDAALLQAAQSISDMRQAADDLAAQLAAQLAADESLASQYAADEAASVDPGYGYIDPGAPDAPALASGEKPYPWLLLAITLLGLGT